MYLKEETRYDQELGIGPWRCVFVYCFVTLIPLGKLRSLWQIMCKRPILRHGVLEQYDAHAGRWQVKLLATRELKAIRRRLREMKDFSKTHHAESLGSWEALLAKD